MKPILYTLFLLLGTITSPASATGDSVIAIENVTVIDGTGGEPMSGMTILIEDQRIRALGPADKTDIPSEAERIEGTGRYLLPGLIDMHAHLAFGPVQPTSVDGMPSMRLEYDESASRRMAAELLRSGITTARNPGGPTGPALAVRDALNSGKWAGPRLRTAGAVIDTSPFKGLVDQVGSPEDVRRTVREQAAAGVDFIKLYASLPPDHLKAGIEAAHAAGLPAIGHLMATDWKSAAELGIDGIVHAMPSSASLLPEETRTAYRESFRGTQFLYEWFEHADLDGPVMQQTLDSMASNGVHLDPTLVAVESIFFGDRDSILGNPDLERVPGVLLDNWRNGMTLTAGWTGSDFERARAVFPKALKLVRQAHEAGVTIVAGTDLGNPWIAPGASLHRELALYVQAGMTPLESIGTATANAARVLGMDDEIGTVAEGKRGDLVLLSANPTEDIGNISHIELVIQDGRIVRDERADGL